MSNVFRPMKNVTDVFQKKPRPAGEHRPVAEHKLVAERKLAVEPPRAEQEQDTSPAEEHKLAEEPRPVAEQDIFQVVGLMSAPVEPDTFPAAEQVQRNIPVQLMVFCMVARRAIFAVWNVLVSAQSRAYIVRPAGLMCARQNIILGKTVRSVSGMAVIVFLLAWMLRRAFMEQRSVINAFRRRFVRIMERFVVVFLVRPERCVSRPDG